MRAFSSALALLTFSAFALLAAAQTSAAQPRLTGAPVALTESGSYQSPEFSPDGSYLAFTTSAFDGLLVIEPEASSTPRTITDAQGVGFGFAWAPDGSAILARKAQLDGNRRMHSVALYDAATGAETVLTEPRDRMATLPAWSADGADVLLPLGGPGEFDRIATGREPVRAKAGQPVALLAGTSIALAEPGAAELADAQPFPGEVILGLVASPSGERIAFKRMGEGIYVMNRDGSGLTFIGEGEEPTWSPDGEWVAVQRSADDGYVFTASDLYLLRADGSETVRLTETPDVLEMRPAFAPSGDALVFDAGGVIYRAPLALR